jgi:hypothetical protein
MAYDVVTTVVTPAESLLLTDLPTIKAELNIPATDTSRDAWLTTKLTNVSDILHQYCNRVFPVQTYQDVVYLQHDHYPWQVPGGVEPLQLSHWPVQSVTSVEVLELAINSFGQGASCPPGSPPPPFPNGFEHGVHFRLDPRPGQLIRLSHFTGLQIPWESKPTTVVYVAGYTTIPGAVVEAALKMLTKMFFSRGRDPLLMQQSQPSGEQRYWVDTGKGGGGNVPPDIQGDLAQFRVPVTA